MELSIQDSDFLDSFEHLGSYNLDDFGKNKLDLFVIQINSNEFDYEYLIDKLIDPMIDFSLSRKVKEKYKKKPATLTKRAKEKFIAHIHNTGELGELLLFCFLESHLKAPKILSKLELKTSTSLYVNGADGVHFLKDKDGNYQLIFGESKTIVKITAAISDAFNSINQFKNSKNSMGNKKSGITYEKSLISDHLEKEVFSDEEKKFIENIIYPKRNNKFNSDDAFGIFVGYELKVTTEDKKLPNNQFRGIIKQKIKAEVEKTFKKILQNIDRYRLHGHNFYIYVLPFTDLDQSRSKIQKGISE